MTVAVTLQQRSKNVFLFLTELFESFYEIRALLKNGKAVIKTFETGLK